MTVSSRDVYVDALWNVYPDGSIAFIIYSVPDYAEEDNLVRMDCFGGFLFEPLKDDPSKCNMTCIMEGDLKGNIPNFVVN